MRNRYTEQQIYDRAGKLTLYNNKLRVFVADALARAPKKVVDYIIENCYVYALEPDMRGVYIPMGHIGDRDMILISDRYLCEEEDIDPVIKTILHECAHCWLKHKSRFDGITLDQQDKQEEEAAALINKWLSR